VKTTFLLPPKPNDLAHPLSVELGLQLLFSYKAPNNNGYIEWPRPNARPYTQLFTYASRRPV